MRQHTLIKSFLAICTALGFVTASLGATEALAEGALPKVEFLGEEIIESSYSYQDTQVGGLSAIAYDAQQDLYYVLSDDRSNINPARFYTLNIDISDGHLNTGDVQFQGVTTLLDSDGMPFAPGSLDPEGMALAGTGVSFFLSSEGDANKLIDPFIRSYSLSGHYLGKLAVADKYLPVEGGSRGIRNNLSFESVAITPDGNHLYSATEGALVQDGPTSDIGQASLIRIFRYDLPMEQVSAEVVYPLDPVYEEPIPADAFRVNGLVELLALDNDGTLLALERAFSVGRGNKVRLYVVNVQEAADVSGLDALWAADGSGAVDFGLVAKKRLVFDFDQLELPLDNLEGMTLGPSLADGRATLLVVSDDNFATSGQFTQFLAFAIDLGDL